MEQNEEKKYEESLRWLMDAYEKSVDRYIADETFLMNYVQLPFWKRWLFGKKMVIKQLEKMLNKYPF